MKQIFMIAPILSFAACAFDPGGLPAPDAPDGGGDLADADPGLDGDVLLDADPGADAAPAAAFIACTTETIDGYPKIVLTFTGDIASGFLGDDPGTLPTIVAYGSDGEDLAVKNSCGGDTWGVPYPSGCTKHSPAWGPTVRLLIEPEVDFMNVALLYPGGIVRWGDLMTSDDDGVGFQVSGSGTFGGGSYNCGLEVLADGSGGSIRTHL